MTAVDHRFPFCKASRISSVVHANGYLGNGVELALIRSFTSFLSPIIEFLTLLCALSTEAC